MAANFCKLAGIVLIAVGIWGFITGDHVLIFHVNTAHNIVHLLSGVLAFACGLAGDRAARVFCIIFGSIYGLVALLGFGGVDWVVRALHLNEADNWLHICIAGAFLIAGITPKPRRQPPTVRGVQHPA